MEGGQHDRLVGRRAPQTAGERATSPGVDRRRLGADPRQPRRTISSTPGSSRAARPPAGETSSVDPSAPRRDRADRRARPAACHRPCRTGQRGGARPAWPSAALRRAGQDAGPPRHVNIRATAGARRHLIQPGAAVGTSTPGAPAAAAALDVRADVTDRPRPAPACHAQRARRASNTMPGQRLAAPAAVVRAVRADLPGLERARAARSTRAFTAAHLPRRQQPAGDAGLVGHHADQDPRGAQPVQRLAGAGHRPRPGPDHRCRARRGRAFRPGRTAPRAAASAPPTAARADAAPPASPAQPRRPAAAGIGDARQRSWSPTSPRRARPGRDPRASDLARSARAQPARRGHAAAAAGPPAASAETAGRRAVVAACRRQPPAAARRRASRQPRPVQRGASARRRRCRAARRTLTQRPRRPHRVASRRAPVHQPIAGARATRSAEVRVLPVGAREALVEAADRSSAARAVRHVGGDPRAPSQARRCCAPSRSGAGRAGSGTRSAPARRRRPARPRQVGGAARRTSRPAGHHVVVQEHHPLARAARQPTLRAAAGPRPPLRSTTALGEHAAPVSGSAAVAAGRSSTTMHLAGHGPSAAPARPASGQPRPADRRDRRRRSRPRSPAPRARPRRTGAPSGTTYGPSTSRSTGAEPKQLQRVARVVHHGPSGGVEAGVDHHRQSGARLELAQQRGEQRLGGGGRPSAPGPCRRRAPPPGSGRATPAAHRGRTACKDSGAGPSKISAARSASTIGATGRNCSRPLTSLSRSTLSGVAGVGQQGPVPERPGPYSLRPENQATTPSAARTSATVPTRSGGRVVAARRGLERSAELLVASSRGRAPPSSSARRGPSRPLDGDVQSGAERGARVAGCRLHPDLLEGPSRGENRVRHAVERGPAGHRQRAARRCARAASARVRAAPPRGAAARSRPGRRAHRSARSSPRAERRGSARAPSRPSR